MYLNDCKIPLEVSKTKGKFVEKMYINNNKIKLDK